jgi:hypothetical protein
MKIVICWPNPEGVETVADPILFCGSEPKAYKKSGTWVLRSTKPMKSVKPDP